MSLATADERYFVSLVNQERAKHGLSAVKIELSLNGSSDAHSQWMLDQDVFSHTGKAGSSSRERMVTAGLDLAGSWMTAENIAYVSVKGEGNLRDEVRTLHKMLMNSPSHRDNILDEDASLIGIGLKVGYFTSGGQAYKVAMVTQNFASTDGDTQLDTGRFRKAALPDADIDMTTRSEWREGFDGLLMKVSGNGGVLRGTSGADDFQLTSGVDRALGRGGDDWMAGRGGRDVLDGGSGNDVILGHAGADRLSGGTGNDTLQGGGDKDRLAGGSGHDLLDGGSGNDRLMGGAGADTLLGQGGNDLLEGGEGRDWLEGGAGRDVLKGAGGADTLDGGAGNDLLIGGGGADTFIFSDGFGSDTIRGYQAGHDKLMLEDLLPNRDMISFIEQNMRETTRGVVIDFGNGDRLLIAGRNQDAEDIATDIFMV